MPENPRHNASTSKPSEYHVVRLYTPDGRKAGVWTGTQWRAYGEEVHPTEWQELEQSLGPSDYTGK